MITSVAPDNSPLQGGGRVTVRGTGLGMNNDVTAASLVGIQTQIVSQNATAVIVTVAPANAAGTGDVVLTTAARGSVTLAAAFTYNAGGVIGSVIPNGAPSTGGALITIVGSRLGSGTDITAVRLVGSNATIVSQTANSVIVTAGAGSGLGDVEVLSTSNGLSRLQSGFIYNPRTCTHECFFLPLYSLFLTL